MTKEEQVKLDTMFNILQQQRDQAQLQVAQLAGELAVLKMQLEEAMKAATPPQEPVAPE